MKTFALVVFLFLLNSIHGARVFPDLTNQENFRKAQYICDLTDYQSSRLYQLQHLFTMLANEIQDDLNLLISEQRVFTLSAERRVDIYKRIGTLKSDLSTLIEAYQRDVETLLSEDQFNNLFSISSVESPLFGFGSSEKVFLQ